MPGAVRVQVVVQASALHEAKDAFCYNCVFIYSEQLPGYKMRLIHVCASLF